jgi:ribosome-associated toxin RatA of RatAB toxin-antitoxin module
MVRFNKAGIRFACILILSWMLSLDVSALEWQVDGDDWTFSRRIGDVDIYLQSVEESAFPALLAHTRIAAPVGAIYAVISDYGHFPDFIPLVLDSRILKQQRSTAWVYQRLSFPFFATDRHYVIRVSDILHQAEAGRIKVEWQLDREQSRSLFSDSAVLPDAFSGSWQLTQLEEGQGSDALYSVHVEPGGILPAWLFSAASESYVFKVIEAVRRSVKERLKRTPPERGSAYRLIR